MTSPGPTPTDLDLMAYADGELPAAERVQVEAWLTGDARARSKLTGLLEVGSLLREPGRTPRDAELTDAIMARIAQAPQTKVRRLESARAYTIVAAAVLAAAASVFLWSRLDADRSTSGVVSVRAPASPALAATAAAGAEPGHEHGVEVWSVDFGSASGAVFYVPNGGASSASSASDTTTVVWLSQAETEPEEGE